MHSLDELKKFQNIVNEGISSQNVAGPVTGNKFRELTSDLKYKMGFKNAVNEIWNIIYRLEEPISKDTLLATLGKMGK
jgi:hypothetical protein